MDLFSHVASKDRRGQPLAERMRPRTLAEFVGQEHILGPGKLLRRALDARALPSLILWGPPGTGKTTLARLLAGEAHARFVALSAVMAGVKDLREAVAEAAQQRDQRNERTVLFVDEIHRFNKAQQDALLPHVEGGTVVLIGATTENPSFEVNAALLSRAKVVVLRSLTEADLRAVDRSRARRRRARAGRAGAGRARRRARPHRARGARRRAPRAGDAGGGGRGRAPTARRRHQGGDAGDRRGGAAEADAAVRQGRATSTTAWSAPSSRACAAPTPTAPSTG